MDKLSEIALNASERTSDRIRCFELIGKQLGGFADNINADVNVRSPIFYIPYNGRAIIDLNVEDDVLTLENEG